MFIIAENGVQVAEKVTNALYSKEGADSLKVLNADELKQAFDGAPIVDLLPEAGLSILEMALRAKCFKSQRKLYTLISFMELYDFFFCVFVDDALRVISAGGFYVNHQQVKNINEEIIPGVHILPTNSTLLRVGKKNYHIVRWV